MGILEFALQAGAELAGVDVVFACGELMAELYEALPPDRRGGYTKTAEELAPLLTADIGAGDVVMVKGSLGSRMAPHGSAG